jgi:hypothetical protein
MKCTDQSEKVLLVHEMKGMKYMKNVWQSKSEESMNRKRDNLELGIKSCSRR